MRTQKQHIAAMLLIFLTATGFMFSVLFTDKHLSAFDFILEKPSWTVERGPIKANNLIISDSVTAHYPYKKEFWDATRKGYNPQYLPHIFTGKPTPGQGVGIFSTSLFQFFMDIPNALDFSTWFRLLLAGVFMYLLLFKLGTGSGPAAVGAIAWMFNLHQIAWLLFPQHLATQLWLPLLFLINIKVIEYRNNLALLLALILCVVFFYTSGYTQIVLYTFIFIGVFNTVYIWLGSQQPALEKIKNWLVVHAVFVIAGMLLLPDALWQAQDIAEGLRGTQDFRHKHYELEFSISSLITLLDDLFPRSIDAVRFLLPNYGTDLGHVPAIKQFFKSNIVEFQVYFGLLVLFLTVYACVRAVVKRDRRLLVFVIVLLLIIAFFNGNATVIGLVNLIPFAGSGTYSRIITLLIMFAIILAAFGLKLIIEDFKSNRNYYALLSFALLCLWVFWVENRYPEAISIREFVPWMVYLLVVCVLCWVLVRRRKAMLVVPIVASLTLAELVVSSYGFNTRLDAKDHFPENEIIKQIRQTPGDFRTALLMDHPGYHHNILTYYDLSTLGGYETTAPNDYIYFMRKAYKNVHLTLNGILFLFDGQLEILRLLNTRYVVSNLPLETDLIEPVYSNDTETLYVFKNPLDRVYCASDQIVESKRNAIPSVLNKLSSKLDRPVIVTESILDREKLTANCQVSDLKAYISKLEFKVNTDQSTLVFIPVNNHEYWRAKINSDTAKIISANYTFMALEVAPGESQISLEFINPKLTLAAYLLLALGLITLLAGIMLKQAAWQRWAFIILAILLIGKSLISIPGVMNMNIPEKPELEHRL